MTEPGDNPLPGVPLVESPLFDLLIDTMDLSDSERDVAISLNRSGFAVIDFPDPLFDERCERIKRRFALDFGIDLDDPESIGLGERRVQDAWAYDEDVRAIAGNENIVELLSKLYGRHAFPFQTLNFPVGTQQAPHTDAVHFSSIPSRFMCGVWVAMEDIGPDSGPLCYVAGSHRWPLLTNEMVGRRGWGSIIPSAQTPYEEIWQAMMAATGLRAETFEARKGQALIWCANLLHGGSQRNIESLTRWSQVTHYFFDDCIYYTPAHSDEALGKLALRQVVSAVDGGEKPNIYLGERIEAVRPEKMIRRVRRVLNRIRRV